MRKLAILLMLLAVATLVGLAAHRVVEILAVDSCLDRGGSFDYQTGACDMEKNHPYMPELRRHPVAGIAASLGVVSGLLSVLLIRRERGLRRRSSP